MSSNIIEINKLKYKDIFNNLSLKIEENSFTTITGTNKCGKTTLMKILCGDIDVLSAVTYKNVYIESYVKTELYSEISSVIPSREIKFVFETVEEELVFILDNLGYSKDEKTKRLKQIVKLFKLNKYLTSNPNNLHRNLRIKVELASATISKPKLLILDDICSMMTKQETEEILNILNYFKEENMTIVLTTDNLNETINSDYIYVLNSGKIALEGIPLDVLKQDNTLNKLGLNLPFMIDLSVKLKDYDLVDDIELDMDKLVNKLWK